MIPEIRLSRTTSLVFFLIKFFILRNFRLSSISSLLTYDLKNPNKTPTTNPITTDNIKEIFTEYELGAFGNRKIVFVLSPLKE